MTAEEKMQREYDIRSIVKEIVPYVIEDPDRFFSSLIVDVYLYHILRKKPPERVAFSTD